MSSLSQVSGQEHISICILDWTFRDTARPGAIKGVLLQSLPPDHVSLYLPLAWPRRFSQGVRPQSREWDQYTGTRVLRCRNSIYVACVASDGAVMLFLVPPLVVAVNGELDRVNVTPIAWTPAPAIEGQFTTLSAWSSCAPTLQGNAHTSSHLSAGPNIPPYIRSCRWAAFLRFHNLVCEGGIHRNILPAVHPTHEANTVPSVIRREHNIVRSRREWYIVRLHRAIPICG